ncbi:hypothetical protein [Tenacibaculum ovolyticum]|uniref:hypothetical protein n=1 Tax=Tenacibaculum ovolyticum TaxID=104270 RepID=UPI0003F5BCEB|nr:hypothetical protein [Tenacibaculum ovolyticum]
MLKKKVGFTKAILSAGKYVSRVLSFGLKMERGMETFSASMRHLQAFEVERKKIWGVKDAPSDELKTE